ncbi:Uncharacterised protein at_DN2358 [Pycnogonum litorale]
MSQVTNVWHKPDFEGFPESEADQLVSYANGRISEDNVKEWIDYDKDLPVVNHLTDEEIIRMVTGESEESDEDVNQPSSPQSNITIQDGGLRLMKECITFMESNNDVTDQEVMTLYRVHERLTQKTFKSLKQGTLTDMFTKK